MSITPAIYDELGVGYTALRRTDPAWQQAIIGALGTAEPVINIGAGTGSYESTDRELLAIEPSSVMIGQRPPGSAPVRQSSAEQLPVADNSFGAAMAVLTVHHWTDWRRGLAEMRRVAPLRIVLAVDIDVLFTFWLVTDYLPELAAYERRSVTAGDIAAELGTTDVRALPLAHDFSDGSYPAFWRRPEAYLNEATWAASSALQRVDPAARQRAVAALAGDIASGAWAGRHADLLARTELDLGHRLIVSRDE